MRRTGLLRAFFVQSLLKLLICALFVGSLVGASMSQAQEKVIQLSVPHGLTYSDSYYINKAIAEWNQVLKGITRLEVQTENPHADWKIELSMTTRAAMDRFGQCDYLNRTITIFANVLAIYNVRSAMLPVMRHELGHMLGSFGHAEGTLMATACCSTMQRIDPATAALVKDYQLRFNR